MASFIPPPPDEEEQFIPPPPDEVSAVIPPPPDEEVSSEELPEHVPTLNQLRQEDRRKLAVGTPESKKASPWELAKSTMTDWGRELGGDISVAANTPPEMRGQVLEYVQQLASAGTQGKYANRNFVDRAVGALASGIGSMVENAEYAVGATLPKDQQEFLDQIRSVREIHDPVVSAEASALDPREWAVGAAGMIPAIRGAQQVGIPAAGGAKLLGAGKTLSTMVGGTTGAGAVFGVPSYREKYQKMKSEGVDDNTAHAVALGGAAAESMLFGGVLGSVLPKIGGEEGLTGKMTEILAKKIPKFAAKSLVRTGHVSATMAEVKAIDETSIELGRWIAGKSDMDFDTAARIAKDSLVAARDAAGPGFILTLPGAMVGNRNKIPKAPIVDPKVQAEIIATGMSSETPTRGQWDKWGLDPQLGRNIRDRRDAAKAWAHEYQQKIFDDLRKLKEPEVAEAAPVEQAAPGDTAAPAEPTAVAPEQPSTGPSAPLPKMPDAVSIANKVIEEIRAARGLGPVEGPEREGFAQWMATAVERTQKNKQYPKMVLDELKESGRAADPVETMALTAYHNDMVQAWKAKTDELFKAVEGGDKATIERAQLESAAIGKEMDAAEEVYRSAGSEAGRALVARKGAVNAEGDLTDYSPANMLRKAIVSNGGKMIDTAQAAEIKKLSDEIIDLKSQLAVKPVEQSIDDATAKYKPKKSFVKRSAPIKVKAAELKSAWEDFKSKLSGPVEPLIKGESGALNVDALASGVKLAGKAMELGIVTFDEFLAASRDFIGEKGEIYTDALREAWDKAKSATGIAALRVEKDNPDSLRRVARRLHRSFVESGMTEREKIVDAVHAELSQIVPDISRREAMDAMSGYGKYTELPMDRTSVIMRDVNGQLQQLAKLDDMRRLKKAASPTGIERREASAAERILIKKVNEEKKKNNFVAPDKAKALKSALDTAKTYAKNSLADMEREIAAKEKIIKERHQLQPDAELVELRKQRELMKALWNETFPKTPMSEAKKIQMAEKATDRLIDKLERDLAVGKVLPEQAKEPLTSPDLEAKRLRLDELKTQREILRDLNHPEFKKDRNNLLYTNYLQRRLADLNEKIAKKDFAKKEIQKRTLTEEQNRLQFKIDEVKQRYEKMREKFEKDQRSKIMKALDIVPGTFNFSRALLTAYDFSAVLNQGAFPVLGHPVMALKAMPSMLKSFMSKEGAWNAMREIQQRARYRQYGQSGLALTAIEGPTNKREEVYFSDLSKYIPGLAGSERSYVTFLNRMRADMFDSMASSLGKLGDVTPYEGKIIAKFINTATGRGDFGAASGAADVLATYFFAPRFALSRFQLILGQPMWRGNLETKKLIAKEYVRTAIGLGTFYAACGLWNQFNKDDPFTFEWDPRSSDFAKVRKGNLRLDPTAGVGSSTVLLSRVVVTGETKVGTGEIAALRKKWTLTEMLGGTNRGTKYGAPKTWGVITQFMRGKLSPISGTAAEVLAGENVVGEETTVKGEIIRNLVPITWRDIYEVMHEQGIEKKTALPLLILMGLRASVYEGATPEQFGTKIAEHEKIVSRSKTGEIEDHRDDISEIVKQAKKLGYTEGEVSAATYIKLKNEGKRDAASSWVRRIHQRWNTN